jgi:DegV family protein with EDD domain
MVPALIIWSGKVLRDGIDIRPKEFYTRLQKDKEMPTTSQPSPDAIHKVFVSLLEKGYDILGVFLSSKLSGTYASAEQAKAMLPDENIEIIDSLTGSMGAGWPILNAARASEKGANLRECKSIVEKALQNVGIFLMVDTLEYLHRGGRIGRAQSFLGNILKLKPILEVADGEFVGLEQIRTRQKALDRLTEILVERVGKRKPVHLGILHANAESTVKLLNEKVSKILRPSETLVTDVSPAVGVHLGPGTVGFAFMAGIE